MIILVCVLEKDGVDVCIANCGRKLSGCHLRKGPYHLEGYFDNGLGTDRGYILRLWGQESDTDHTVVYIHIDRELSRDHGDFALGVVRLV